jgi:hypothetical protein
MEPTINNNNNRTEDEAIVSYHETVDPVDEDEVVININDNSFHPDHDIIGNNDTNHVDNVIGNNASNDDARQVRFDATVMASIINEAMADADEDQFIVASFAQLQDVDDVYENDEPDIVCCAHVAYELDD